MLVGSFIIAVRGCVFDWGSLLVDGFDFSRCWSL
jgi:hypothetical protein